MIYFNKVSKVFPGNCVALKDVSFGISEKEFVSIVGKSGAGKTTLLRLILAEEKPTKGNVSFEEKDISKLRKSHLPYYRRNIGVVYQDYKLLSNKTIFENVAFALEILGKPDKEIEKVVPQALELVGILNKADNFPEQLSGGEQQRAVLARAVVSEPKAILADEPTGDLDIYNTKEIMRLLLRINELGTAVILATHNKEIVNMVKRRVIVMDEGKLIKDAQESGYHI